MASNDHTCLVCGEPVDLAARHVVVTRQVETQTRRSVHVHDAEVLAYLHEDHPQRVRVEVDR